MIEMRRLKNVVIFIQAIVFFFSADVYYMEYLGS